MAGKRTLFTQPTSLTKDRDRLLAPRPRPIPGPAASGYYFPGRHTARRESFAVPASCLRFRTSPFQHFEATEPRLLNDFSTPVWLYIRLRSAKCPLRVNNGMQVFASWVGLMSMPCRAYLRIFLQVKVSPGYERLATTVLWCEMCSHDVALSIHRRCVLCA